MNKEYILTFDKNVISKEAILQVISIYKGKADFDLKLIESNEYKLIAREIGEEEISLQNLKQDLTDQQVRIDLEKNFGSLRADIVRYAFSSAENFNE